MVIREGIGSFLLLFALATSAFADVTAVVVIEPTSRKEGMTLSRLGFESSLSKLLGQEVSVTSTDDLTDAMRATRSGGYDVFIAPAQVAASALAHGYELVGSTDPAEQYVLVVTPQIKTAADMRKARMYLPQQDSIYTYMARGMLTAKGMSLKDIKNVKYAHYPQAGLVGITMGIIEATVIKRKEWDSWVTDNPGAAQVLDSTPAVPGGFSVAIKKNLPADTRAKIGRWFMSAASTYGMKPVAQHAALADYTAISQLGTFTPTKLPGATVVAASDVQRLVAQGAVVVDTRNEAEYKQKHIPGAILVPYHEKSLKDVAYDLTLDDFSGLANLDRKQPTIFHCNGPECWKSYKASKLAVDKGFKSVYWFRGGIPEWENASLQTVKE